MSVFDPNSFLNTTFEEANSTVALPIPVGEYTALAEKVDCKQWTSKDGSDSGLKLQIMWEIQDDNVKQLLDRQKIVARQEVMLDLTEAGGLDFGKGKNVQLGRLREALQLNEAGKPFGFTMIPGRVAKIVIGHRVDREDSAKIYSEVKAVARA